MCGHGTIGVVVTLAHLGRVQEGSHRLETPVGIVSFEYHGSGRVSIENVPSYRLTARQTVEVPGFGKVTGDVAWGGNWFFLVEDHQQVLDLKYVEPLTEFTWAIRQALTAQGITGTDGGEIDHIELCGPPRNPQADSRNFVLCPGRAYDRSPCGTGTSARLACLHADEHLIPGAIWRQESIIGSMFEASYRLEDDQLIPRITGSAFLCAESKLIFDSKDPFRSGIPR